MLASLDLFSGYGGISLGLKNYVRPVGYCEIDDYARAILASRISEGELSFAPIHPDVTKLRGANGCADIITGGFPCQDISVAGLGKGLAGERSGLFYEIIRLTKEIEPTFVFLENVPAIRTRGLREVIRAFTEVGYDCRWTCLSAASVGAPHKRERWFLLAHPNRSNLRDSKSRGLSGLSSITRNNGAQEFMADTESKRCGEEGEFRRTQPSEWTASSSQKMANPAGFRSGERAVEGRQPRQQDDIMRKDWWSAEPDVGRVANGTSLRVDRIKALGNGVVPLQVKTAFEKLIGLKGD